MSSWWLTRNACTSLGAWSRLQPCSCSELLRDLAGAELCRAEPGRCLSQPRAFARHLGTDDHKEHDDQRKQERVDHCNGAAAALEHLLQVIYQRAHQVGEEDGEQEGDQGGAGDVEKAQPQREQQHRDNDPRRT